MNLKIKGEVKSCRWPDCKKTTVGEYVYCTWHVQSGEHHPKTQKEAIIENRKRNEDL